MLRPHLVLLTTAVAAVVLLLLLTPHQTSAVRPSAIPRATAQSIAAAVARSRHEAAARAAAASSTAGTAAPGGASTPATTATATISNPESESESESESAVEAEGSASVRAAASEASEAEAASRSSSSISFSSFQTRITAAFADAATAQQNPSSRMQAIRAVDGAATLVEVELPAIKPHEVLVEVHYAGVNRIDVLQRKGAAPPPAGVTDVLGLEVAGRVVEVGSECKSELEPGMLVCALLSGGGYAQYAAVDERLLIQVPGGLDAKVAATIPEAWLTAYKLLHTVGRVKAGDVVIVTAAGSGVGVAAIQLAVAAGARVIAIASASKLETAKKLGAEFTIDYKATPNFGEVVQKMTEGRGANVILDCVGGSFSKELAASAANDSAWVLFGLLSGPQPDTALLASILRKRIRLEGTTMRARPVTWKAELVSQFVGAQVMQKLATGGFQQLVDREFPLAEAAAALEYIESNESIGKVVLKVVADKS